MINGFIHMSFTYLQTGFFLGLFHPHRIHPPLIHPSGYRYSLPTSGQTPPGLHQKPQAMKESKSPPKEWKANAKRLVASSKMAGYVNTHKESSK